MEEEIGDIDKAGYIYANPATGLNCDDPKVANKLQVHNPSLLLRHYRTAGKKEQAIGLLLSIRRHDKKARITIRIIKEIVYTYLYFGDYNGALEHIRHYELMCAEVRYIDCMLRIRAEYISGVLEEKRMHELVSESLRFGYNEYAIPALLEFHQRGGCTLDVLHERLTALSEFFVDEYMEGMTYEQLKYLYCVMPGKTKFLKRMVEVNPHIGRRYYREYAKIYGIWREDIMRILEAGYREWALRIAFDKGWIDESLRAVIDRQFMDKPVFINRHGEWSHRDDKKGIMFMKRL